MQCLIVFTKLVLGLRDTFSLIIMLLEQMKLILLNIRQNSCSCLFSVAVKPIINEAASSKFNSSQNSIGMKSVPLRSYFLIKFKFTNHDETRLFLRYVLYLSSTILLKLLFRNMEKVVIFKRRNHYQIEKHIRS